MTVHLVGFECPTCHHVTYHPQDVKEGYCVLCHDWTRDALVQSPDPFERDPRD